MTGADGALYRGLVWSLALALLGAGALLSIQMISAVVGPFRLAQMGAHDPRDAVVLLRDASQPIGAALRSSFGHELVGSGRSVREVASLLELDPATTGSIVLSEPRVLGEDEGAALRNYLAGGGGAVLIGSVGVRDAAGGWLGYDTMSNLLGAEVTPQDEARARAIVASGRGPIAAALAPRQRINVIPEPGLPGATLAEAELRWAGAQANAAAPAAALRRDFGAGRLAWIAVGPDRAATTGADQRRLRHVLEAAVAWTSRTPWVEVLPWPGGAPFAGVVERDAPDAAASARPELAWQREIDAAALEGGVARLMLPDSARSEGSTEKQLASAMGELGRRGAWVATRRELSTWTRERAAVEASVRRAGPRRVVVEVTNFGAARRRAWCCGSGSTNPCAAPKQKPPCCYRTPPRCDSCRTPRYSISSCPTSMRARARPSRSTTNPSCPHKTARRIACESLCTPSSRWRHWSSPSPAPRVPPSAGSTPSRPRSV